MTYPIAIIDAFTDSPFKGNQAAVCILNDDSANPSDTWMQSVAAEMNLSETAFLSKRPDGSWNLRWFTPTVEINLCGHATLASAHALWELHGETAPTLRFQTRSGELTAKKTAGGIQLDFPVTEITDPVSPTDCEPLIEALELPGTQITAAHVFQANEDLLVMLKSGETVEAVQPNITRLAEISCRGVIVTGMGGRNGVDFTSRFFAPGAGIAEDPVTGSAHCALANFWSARLGKKSMRGYQASKRGGYVGVTLQGERVLLDGQAVTVMKGALC